MKTFTKDMYSCNTCGRKSPWAALDQECNCPACGCETSYIDTLPAEWASVAVYQVDRAYGGPEEGGWYYDCGTLVPETVRAYEQDDFPQASEYVEMLQRRWPANEGYRVRYQIEGLPEASFPRERPYYC